MGRRHLAWAMLACLATGCGGSAGDHGGAAFKQQRAFRDLAAQVRFGPRPAGSAAAAREAHWLSERLGAAGVRRVQVQRPYRNVVGEIPGSEPGAVVIGAHYDTKDIPHFVGANDGASGVAVLLELARDLPGRLDGPAIELVFFDAEESRGPSSGSAAFERSGDRGSTQYVRYAAAGGRQGSPPLDDIEAMVLFDMVGDCDLAVPREATSDSSLYGPFADARERGTGAPAPFGGTTASVDDDHTPFERAGVPSVDLIDFDYGPGPAPGAWWHTTRDDLHHVCPDSLGAVGRPALEALSDGYP